jgi:hypothetical protein
MLLLLINATVLSCKIQASASSENFAGNHLYQPGMNFQQFIAFHHCESFITYTTSLAVLGNIMGWFSSMPGNKWNH